MRPSWIPFASLAGHRTPARMLPWQGKQNFAPGTSGQSSGRIPSPQTARPPYSRDRARHPPECPGFPSGGSAVQSPRTMRRGSDNLDSITGSTAPPSHRRHHQPHQPKRPAKRKFPPNDYLNRGKRLFPKPQMRRDRLFAAPDLPNRMRRPIVAIVDRPIALHLPIQRATIPSKMLRDHSHPQILPPHRSDLTPFFRA